MSSPQPTPQPDPTPSEVRFFVPGVPAAQGSKRHVGKGRLIEQSKRVTPWRNQVAHVAFQHITQPLDGPVHLDVVFVMPRTKAMGKKPAPPMVQRPDTDKMLRAIDDALTGIAFTDDSQITHITAHKRRAGPGEKPGAHITIEQIKEDE